ncbi:MAG: 7TM diverse intracellular signaling domain-containing protein [Bacteroidota bacterium]
MTRFTPLFLLLLFIGKAGFTQPGAVSRNNAPEQITTWAVLPDKNYSFNQVLTDSSLRFIQNDSLRPALAVNYWIRIQVANPSHYTVPVLFRVFPNFHNILFAFDPDTQKWLSRDAGMMVASDRNRQAGILPYHLLGKDTNTLYVKVLVQPLQRFGYAVQPKVFWVKEADNNRTEQLIWIAWLISLTIMIPFILNNLYLYFSFRDKTVLYYLIGQVAGMIYITSSKAFFLLLFPGRVFNDQLYANGTYKYYNIENLLIHISVALIMYGFVQMTRSYLLTRKTLPRLDAVLKYMLYGYLLFTAVLLIVNNFVYLVESYTLVPDNIFVALLVATVLYTCITAYKQRLPAARSFLLANLLPLLFTGAVACYHIFFGFANEASSMLPNLAICSQTVAFSIALVARIRLIKNELAAKETEARQLMFEIKEMELRHGVVELENEKISSEMSAEKTRNELLKEKLEANQRELASATLYMVQKNELLATLKTEIKELNKQYPNNKHQGLQGIESILQTNLFLDDDWNKFKLHFEQVHPHFFQDLQAKYPTLTNNELRLYAYFHINLSTKEIATLLNIEPQSVRQAKMRLYKKMAL